MTMYFFIVGCPRSGTTLLQQALNRHSQIAIPPETKYFSSFVGHCARCQCRLIDRLNADLGIALPRPAEAIRSVADGRSFFNLIADLYLQRLGKKGVVYFGEKTPEHTSHIRRIHSFFPDAKMLLIYRDGRDVALSLSKMPWLCRDLYTGFLVWLYYFRQQMRAQKMPGLELHCVQYEALVADPVAELRKVTDFLGLSYEPGIAEGYGNRDGVPEREYAWKGRALEPIVTDRVAVWRQELAPSEVEKLEVLGGTALKALGYQLVTKVRRRLGPLVFAEFCRSLLLLLSKLPPQLVTSQLLGRAWCLH